MEEIRLQKYLSENGVLSRRAAEKEIESGAVLVNGHAVPLGTKVVPFRDQVSYRGKVIQPKRSDEEKIYLILNKPRGVITTMHDERGRRCVADLIDLPNRVFPVGRLDRESEGLLLLTDDGEFANRMMHPRHEIPKIYQVLLGAKLSEAQLVQLGSPMVIDGYEIDPVKCRVLEYNGAGTVLEMVLYEGRNRQIRKMCEKCGIPVLRLRRVAIGNVTLQGLGRGKWRQLSPAEKRALRIGRSAKD